MAGGAIGLLEDQASSRWDDDVAVGHRGEPMMTIGSFVSWLKTIGSFVSWLKCVVLCEPQNSWLLRQWSIQSLARRRPMVMRGVVCVVRSLEVRGDS